MKKKQLLLTMMLLLASVTGVFAAVNAGDIVSITNIRNIIPGWTGSFDIVLNENNTNVFSDLGFDVQLPEGYTYLDYSDGELLTSSHNNRTVTAQGNNTQRFSILSNGGSTDFTGAQGVLMTVFFTVGENSGTAYVKGDPKASFTLGTESYFADDASATLTVQTGDVKTVTLIENDKYAPTAIENANVIIKRKLKANVWNTIVLPFDIAQTDIETIFGADTEVAQFTGAAFTTEKVNQGMSTVTICTGIAVNFTKSLTGEKMWSGYPYLIKVKEEKNQLSVDGISINPNLYPLPVEEQGTMYGSYTPTNVPNGNLYVSNNQFKYSGGNAKIKGMRGYFDLYRKLNNYTSDVSASRNIKFDIDGESTTGIFNLEEGTIETKCKYFNLKGQRVLNPTKGVYIVNGKKVMFK